LADLVDLGPARKALMLDDVAEDSERFDVHKGILS
jgi:hypothetical protein